MKSQYKVALGLVFVSWLATGLIWLQQRNAGWAEERMMQQSLRGMQNSGGSQWGGMRQRWVQVSPEKKKILTVPIIQQLDAFKRNDYTKAAEFQSQALRQNFSSTAMFRAIIRRSYPEFADYKSVSFGKARMDPRQKRAAVVTLVTGKNGKTSRVVYFLVNENNQYRVDGVARARDPGRFQAPPQAPGRPGPDKPAPDTIAPGVSSPRKSVPPAAPSTPALPNPGAQLA